MTIDDLIERARQARASAYAPYSRFAVGAALETTDGRVFAGCNVENVSSGLTVCAERMAVGVACLDGPFTIRRVVVVADSNPPASPCGACRQVLAEFAADCEVISVGPLGRRAWRLAELLPDRFHRPDLPN